MWRGFGLGQQEYQQAYQRQLQHDRAYNMQQQHDESYNLQRQHDRRFNMYQHARGLQQQHDQAYILQQQYDQRNENARGPQGGGFGWGRSFHGNRGPSYGFNHGGGGQNDNFLRRMQRRFF
ncbi:hypothetical protein LTR35_006770 [Friedmanniomyces endolithicus]|nr:hypothetical protein LTR35_006770 [Friedmanniomyces endolithicus]KAK0304386.1 hypothetical protein LTR01_007487 [Friedmanniomyces endolithicus]KAK0983692.1 hypothetical protein LTS01_010959 [Friedmanniomyces endolithicus]